MLKVNKKVEYALMALKYMSSKPKDTLVSAREIGEQFSIPFDTTAKVLQIMNGADFLESIKGIHGGYKLSKRLSEITYIELAKLIEGKIDSDFCYNSKGEVCDLYDSCNISTPLDALNKKLNAYLKTITLEELLIEEMSVGSNSEITERITV